METVSLYSAAKNIISGFKNNEDNSLVLENWKTLASALNQFPTYAEIPYIPDVPLAMYMYVMKYTSKRSEENSIRAITTFGVLMNAIEHTDDVDKHGYLALIASLISHYKKHFDNLNNFSLFPISIPQEKEDFNRILVDYGDTTAYFDSIFLYIYNLIDNDSQSFFGNDEIKRKYIAYKESFLNEYNQKEHGTEENLNGNRVLRDCYDRMNQIGKCPIYVPSSTNSDIYNKTYGLIPHGLTFFASKFFMQETTGNMSEGELNMQIKIDIQDDMMQTFCEGIDEQYLKSQMFLPIQDNHVAKKDQYIELNFNLSKVYRDDNRKYRNVDNVPTSMELHFEHFKLAQIVLTFIVGDQGWMRTLYLYGKCM